MSGIKKLQTLSFDFKAKVGLEVMREQESSAALFSRFVTDYLSE